MAQDLPEGGKEEIYTLRALYKDLGDLLVNARLLELVGKRHAASTRKMARKMDTLALFLALLTEAAAYSAEHHATRIGDQGSKAPQTWKTSPKGLARETPPNRQRKTPSDNIGQETTPQYPFQGSKALLTQK